MLRTEVNGCRVENNFSYTLSKQTYAIFAPDFTHPAIMVFVIKPEGKQQLCTVAMLLFHSYILHKYYCNETANFPLISGSQLRNSIFRHALLLFFKEIKMYGTGVYFNDIIYVPSFV